ncbi:MAG TPA: hypothetical protein VHL98_00150 [Microvirga sp.]|jgi:hypothetical protein|nr:hypothetical protein [Microvirga sp.]
MIAVGRYFVIGMLAFGVLAGLVLANVHALRDLPVPAIVWPILVGLVIDLILQAYAREGRVEPLTMNERAFGIIGAGLIITGIVALSG